jgi:CIC family chloride channel protein
MWLKRPRLQSQLRMLGSAVLIGVVAGLGAIGFYLATRVIERLVLGSLVGYDLPVHPGGETEIAWLPAISGTFYPWLLLVVPTVGGLLSGFLVYTFAPEAEGHGTDAVIDAYHRKGGVIRPRVPLIKTIASALTLGTGGSGGREGPIAQIGGGCGSILGGLLKVRPAERRVMLAAGMGAGIAAVFRAPLAGALFSAEVLYASPEFEAEVIIPAGLASVVSYCTFGVYAGWQPLFTIPDLKFNNPWQLGPYSVLAVWMVLLAMLYTHGFYGLTHWFHRWRIPAHFKPAVGAFLTGAVGVSLYYAFGRDRSVLAVMSFGYGALQQAMGDHQMVGAVVLLAISLGKILTTSLTIGSGGSGGVFGPSMVIGGCGAAALGLLFQGWLPGLGIQPAAFAIVGMAGFFAAAAKTPFSTILMVSEMTGGYQLLLPALWVCMLAFILSDQQSIYSAQVASHSLSPAHQGSYVRDVLAGLRVGQFLAKGSPTTALKANDPLALVLTRISGANVSVLPVIDGENRLLGVVNLEEIHFASQSADLGSLIVAVDLMRGDVVPLVADDPLDLAQEMFVESDLLSLPIVDNLQDRKLLGMIRRFDIANAYLRHLQGMPAARPARK